MSVLPGTALKSFVVMSVGGRKFSFPAESVIELVVREDVQQFPHRTPWISGVIIRRGRVVPVCDLRHLMGETNPPSGRFHLIVEWQSGNTRDWCAIPVAGECELAGAEQILPVDYAEENATGKNVPHIAGFLQVGEERIAIIDLAKLIGKHQFSSEARATERNS